ncbi:hypothetical protein GQ53DRAFT_750972 [Thozetella sp. PMI_491]|nr:hypothetical protein GQ53DRAFT_750972 [Thozetella sp. PMI_491]
MQRSFRALLRTPVRWLASPRDYDDDATDTDSWDTESVNDWPFEPTVADVMVVKAMVSKALNLPNEIVDTIVDLAEYWPHTTVEAEHTAEPGNHNQSWWKAIRGGQPTREDQFLIRSPPLGFPPIPRDQLEAYTQTPIPAAPLKHEFTIEQLQEHIRTIVPLVQHPCRMIVFTIESHDQGWGSREDPELGKYNASWTWFSAGLERLESGESAGNDSADTETKAAGEPQECEENAAKQMGPDVTSRIAASPDQPNSVNLAKVRPIWPEIHRPPNTSSTVTESYEYFHELHTKEDRKVQANVTVEQKPMQHRVVWRYDDDIDPESDRAETELKRMGRGKATGNGEFVRNLKLGDIVTLWGHSRFPGWVNYVNKVKIEVFYAV